MNPYNEYGGLLHRRECLLPTWKGLLLLLILAVGSITLIIATVQPFLAVTKPVPAKVLVVEGWVPDYVLMEAKNEFERGGYHKLYITGGPLEKGNAFFEYKTFAELGAAILLKMGVNKNAIEAAPAPTTRQDRTYASALALKNLLHQQGIKETGINLMTLGAHSRRSQLLFQNAFGDDSQIGIIAIEDRGYDPRHWWKYSAGVRAVFDESFAYVYARVIFPLAKP